MYPLVIIYGTAILKNNISIALPGLILSGIGFCVSTYHYLVQKLPAFQEVGDRKSTRLNSSHVAISYAVFCLKKKKERYWTAHMKSRFIRRHVLHDVGDRPI